MATIIPAATIIQPVPANTPAPDDTAFQGIHDEQGVANAHKIVCNKATTPVKNEQNCSRRVPVARFIRSLPCFFKKLLREKTGGNEVDVISVMSLSDLGSAGSQNDDKTEPQPMVPAASARNPRESDTFAGHPLSRTSPIAHIIMTVTVEEHMYFGHPRKMARVVRWFNDDTAEDYNKSRSSEDGSD